jgi:hypothetical protein
VFYLSDIDECLEPGNCSQFCQYEKGVQMQLRRGLSQRSTQFNTLQSREGQTHASLLFARRHDIQKVALDRQEMTAIVNNTKMATALDFVFRTDDLLERRQ